MVPQVKLRLSLKDWPYLDSSHLVHIDAIVGPSPVIRHRSIIWKKSIKQARESRLAAPGVNFADEAGVAKWCEGNTV